MLKTKRNKILRILKWCENNLEYKTQAPIPKLRVYKGSGSSITGVAIAGCFRDDKNTISIFLRSNKNLLDLCNTVIHEFQHFILDKTRRGEYTKITIKMKKNGYSNEEIVFEHPHEKKCIKIAEENEQLCYMQIKKCK